MTTKRLKRVQLPFEIKAVETKEDVVRVSGYVAVFDNVDHYGDRVMRGAFARSLAVHAAEGKMPALLWQHNSDWPIGAWRAMEEDDHGLKVEGELAPTALGRDAGALLRMGAISGASIGYFAVKWDPPDNGGVRNLTELDLLEASLVTFPANEMARVEARASEIASMEVKEIERLLREAGLPSRETKTVISRLMSFGAERDADRRMATVETVAALDRLARTMGC